MEKFMPYPAVGEGMVIVGSSDNYIYAVSQKKGKLKWKVKTDNSCVG
jgi:outer membrane protein assembly factor BamB